MPLTPGPPGSVSPLRLTIALVVVFVCGVLVALQSRITGELGHRLGDGFLAALISFTSGFVILLVGIVVWRPGRRGMVRIWSAVRRREIPWWYTVGGVAGAFFVLSQGLAVGLLGVALFTVAVVCGQSITSLVIDHRGLGSMHRRHATPIRIAGAVLAVIAVGVAVSGEIRDDAPYLAMILPLIAGVAVGWQSAVNGQVREISGSAFSATLNNFIAGTTVLLIVTVVHGSIVGWNFDLPREWWLYLAGPIGVIFIATQAVLVRITGVLLLGLTVLAGQLVGSVVFDIVTPVEGGELQVTTIVGTVLVFVAVLLAVVRPRRRVKATSADPSH